MLPKDRVPLSNAIGDDVHTSQPRPIELPRPLKVVTPSDTSTTDLVPDGVYSSDDEVLALGVSISRAQTRLADPKTPAVEKLAVLEDGGGYFAAINGDVGFAESDGDASPIVGPAVRQEQGSEFNQVDGASQSRRESDGQSGDGKVLSLPSPWIAGPREFDFVNAKTSHRASMSNDAIQRQRSASDPLRLHLPFGLPSLPNPTTYLQQLLNSDANGGAKQAQPTRDLFAKRKSGGVTALSGFSWDSFAARLLNGKESTHGTQQDRDRAQVPARVSDSRQSRPADKQPMDDSKVKRSNSEDSLQLHRALSTASSLGDDTRFADISEQVNSRMKAIRDTIQDHNLRLPRPSLPSGTMSNPLTSRLARSSASQSRDRGTAKSQATSSSTSQSHVNDLGPPIPSAKSGRGAGLADTAMHPHLTRALSTLKGDIVILGGYRGSVLRETRPPHRRCWIPLKAGLGLSKVDLEVGLQDSDEEAMPQSIYASDMLTHIGPVDISRRLLRLLRTCENAVNGELRVHEYAYDWRLSPHRLSRQLLEFIAELPCNGSGVPANERGAIVIAHSLGGLLTCHAVNQRPDLFAGILYAGTPFHRCINILGPLRNGDDVLLSSKVLTAQVNFTIRTSFALLPLDGFAFIDKETKEEYPVDFFNVQHWIEHRWSPVLGGPLPALLPPPKTGLSSMLASATSSLPSLPSLPGGLSAALAERPFGLRKQPDAMAQSAKDTEQRTATTAKSSTAAMKGGGGSTGASMAPQMGGSPPTTSASSGGNSSATAVAVDADVTITREAAIEYLTRTLFAVKRFKQELAHDPTTSYPPIAVMYGKSTPTVYAARVNGLDGIKRADAYDNLAFASGDGVVLAKAAMLPDGYRAVKGGVVASERGHISLLADLEGVGRALDAIVRARHP